jgi:hypothetical protein
MQIRERLRCGCVALLVMVTAAVGYGQSPLEDLIIVHPEQPQSTRPVALEIHGYLGSGACGVTKHHHEKEGSVVQVVAEVWAGPWAVPCFYQFKEQVRGLTPGWWTVEYYVGYATDSALNESSQPVLRALLLFYVDSGPTKYTASNHEATD